MDKLVLYHGSSEIIEKPEYVKGKPYNDYGPGFYCTEHIELAKEWACAEDTNGFVNIYELDLSTLKVLNLSSDEFTICTFFIVCSEKRRR